MTSGPHAAADVGALARILVALVVRVRVVHAALGRQLQPGDRRPVEGGAAEEALQLQALLHRVDVPDELARRAVGRVAEARRAEQLVGRGRRRRCRRTASRDRGRCSRWRCRGWPTWRCGKLNVPRSDVCAEPVRVDLLRAGRTPELRRDAVDLEVGHVVRPGLVVTTDADEVLHDVAAAAHLDAGAAERPVGERLRVLARPRVPAREAVHHALAGREGGQLALHGGGGDRRRW